MKKLYLPLIFALACTTVVACGGTSGSAPTGPNVVKMVGGTFAIAAISIHKGDTITFVDDSGNGALHILVIGQNAQQTTEKNAPDFGGTAGKRIDVGENWTTPPWTTAGTFHVTCTVHPAMNLTITVS
ncbi:MAG TPA: hypothetical protein VFU49_20405 [Ktedonobacteraceae bacterium]|nr:hypothetical protein [Ktedonobacteraceae bacterium]